MIQAHFRNFTLPQKKFIPSTRPLQNHVFFQKMNAFWVCLCLSAYGRPFVACCPRQHTRLTAPLFHTRRSRRLPKRAFSDTPPYHYITPLPHTKFAHSTHRAQPTHFACSTHQAQLTHHARPRATSNHPTLCYILHLTVTK